ncbi:MAG: S-layer homology domain-containing protein [Bacillota bacterium]
MKSKLALTFSIILVLLLLCALPAAANNMNTTANYLEKSVSGSNYDGMLDWPILALSQMDRDVSTLITRREAQVRKGELFEPTKSTDYHRTIIGAVAAGNDPRNFAEYNLIDSVKKSQRSNGKFADSISGTGDFLVNAHIWGIISLFVAGETIPNREKALQWLVDNQNADGGFSIDTRVKSSDIDMTGMALMAFAALGENQNHSAVKKAVEYLRNQQGEKGDFVSWGGASSESLSQVIQGLIMLGIDPAGPQWTKRDGNLITALLAYRRSDGSFSHSPGGPSNIMATYQSMMALNDYYSGESIFQKLRRENIRFSDVPERYFAAAAIKRLAAHGVIGGYPDGTFRPANPVKRQEFAKMIVLTLNKNEPLTSTTRAFRDLPVSHWANPYVKVAVDKGLIQGKTAQTFAPEENITGAEVMTILIRALGQENNASPAQGEPWYAGYVRAAEQRGLLYPGFDPMKPATRAQCAYSLERLLK